MGQIALLPEGGPKNRKSIGEGGNFADIGGSHEGYKSASGQARRFLLQPSSPSEWIAAFRTSTDDELVSLLEEGISSEHDLGITYFDLTPLCAELRNVASRIQKYRAFEKTMGPKMETHSDVTQSKDHFTSSTVCFYNIGSSSNENAENDLNLIDLCERILEASSSRASHYIHLKNRRKGSNEDTTRKPILTLSRVRQKLVPSRLKEHIFWESLWVLLYERKKLRQQQEFFTRIKNSTKDAESNNDQSDIQDNSYNKNRIALLEQQLKDARGCISGLILRYNTETKEREEMEKLILKMWDMIPRDHNQGKRLQIASVDVADHSGDNMSPASGKEDDPPESSIAIAANVEKISAVTQHSSCRHTGTWVMTKDSIEFLTYPSEAKEALRSEKQKRLKRVMEEMTFILDSDHPKDSHGAWSCCNKTDYNTACGSEVAK